ncbi:hypothetical protein M0813_23270 [Anaeramoeba flamelloides]|uniref:GOST seven transmembrane domain-containing protein n=1 Tax=Anaeramoeba flamelloides TaxID=1746091 RepID=A0ABQ8Y9J5_9EUKA|nr:hypothetical protein M0813_23270 [Anaeramoeba flamelloides]
MKIKQFNLGTHFLFFILVFKLSTCCVNKHIAEDDDRTNIVIEEFGFLKSGTLTLIIKSLEIHPNPIVRDQKLDCGILIYQINQQTKSESELCSMLIEGDTTNTFTVLNTANKWKEGFTFTKKITKKGLYQMSYINCLTDSKTTNFEITSRLKNPDSFLSAGQLPLPTIYLLFFVLYLSLNIVWLKFLKKKNAKVYKLQWFMSVLLISKTLSILCKSFEYHSLSTTGDQNGANIPFYVFHLLKGVLLFVVILVVVTGWSFIQNALTPRDKKLFFVIILCQVVVNIASIILDRRDPNSRGWFRGSQLLRYTDMLCIMWILYRMSDTIVKLKTITSTDNVKNTRNIEKLTIVKEFYIITFVYIYFTRIVCDVLEEIVPFEWTWVVNLFEELSAIIFYYYVGFRFRPIPENPYQRLRNESDNEEEDDSTIDLEQLHIDNAVIKRVNQSLDDEEININENNLINKSEEDEENKTQNTPSSSSSSNSNSNSN